MKQKINKIFTPEHLIFNVECKNIKDAFHIIAKKAKSLGIVNDANELVNGFTKREKIASTNMQQSFAIPHTMSAHINFPAIIVVKFKSPII
jgi:PTS system fructose-specific IIA component